MVDPGSRQCDLERAAGVRRTGALYLNGRAERQPTNHGDAVRPTRGLYRANLASDRVLPDDDLGPAKDESSVGQRVRGVRAAYVSREDTRRVACAVATA